ncbi:hypothetical protein BDK51DRAFT_37844 [Blyttiomyces helicus]|uniref:RNI-like protein n=1 Tax=Blyttiomyces helicus TaxID=388810 RepID=A0A4P9WAA9_9FUNG|nr:hypothetical protein BDK51DRAFT_37844 [Blyttiomyces helicus]|eukprot:RKO89521.1 hypothetical protein BDK51DRAFT_37844 [Blyttiomyces helicus]
MDRASLVRIFALELNDGDLPEDFSDFVPRIRGLHAFSSRLIPSVAATAAMLCSCPHLIALDIPIPMLTHRGEDEDPILAFSGAVNLPAVARAAARLKCLRLSERRRSPTDLIFCTTLILSLGAPLVELPTDYSKCEGPDPYIPPFGADALPNFEILELLLAFLRACPTITHLDLSSAFDIPDATLALLQTQPPLTVLIANSYTSTGLEHCLRVRGSNLNILDISGSTCVDADLLACIAETTPLLESLDLRDCLGPPSRFFTLEDLRFIESLKRGCSNLCYVGLRTKPHWASSRLSELEALIERFLADLGVDIDGRLDIVPETLFDWF